MGVMASSLLWVMQDLYHQPYWYQVRQGFLPGFLGVPRMGQGLGLNLSFEGFKGWELTVQDPQP